jgi:hypothetical protein
MERYQRSFDAMALQQLLAQACIFGGNGIHRAQHFERAQSNVVQVPNRGGNYI